MGENYYTVTISASDPPSVESEGHVPAPTNPGVFVGWLAWAGQDQQQTQLFTGLKVRVTTRKDGIWTHAMVAEETIDLSGNDIIDFIGASVSKTVRMNGHFNFHYDEALGNLGMGRGYIIDSWNEI